MPKHSGVVQRKRSARFGSTGREWRPATGGGRRRLKRDFTRASPKQTSCVSEKTYLRTGDLGFIRGGELFVTGRVKDLIIIRGRNLYPHDLELAVEQSHEALQAGGGAAFSLEVEGEERLVVVQELEARRRADLPAVIELIRQTLAEEFEVQPYAILLVKAGSVPKTSSGKIQRSACRTRFETGVFDALAEWRAPLDFGIDNSEQIETAELSNSEAIATWIRGQLAAKLGVDDGSIDINSSITRYGVDSLIVIELAHSIETQLGVLLPMSEFISSQSITQMAVRCFELIEATRSAPPVSRCRFRRGSAQPTCSRCLTDNRLSGSSNNSHQKAWLITSLRRSG